MKKILAWAVPLLRVQSAQNPTMDEVNCYDGSTENAQTIPSIRSEEADTSNPTAITEQQQLVTALVPVPVPVLPPINDLPIVTLPADDVATATATVATAGILDDIQAQQKRKGVMHKVCQAKFVVFRDAPSF